MKSGEAAQYVEGVRKELDTLQSKCTDIENEHNSAVTQNEWNEKCYEMQLGFLQKRLLVCVIPFLWWCPLCLISISLS